ncbi:MAG: glycine cleavage system protein GcvH [Gammaproteobacteria bacterium]|nr:glycine cleavage system protein GcvH [Gammaproteobacteria bacterium]
MSTEKYTEDHEWLRPDEDGTVTVGITEYAQEQLGDIVFIELPEPGTDFEPGSEMAVIESVKAAGDVKIPLAGEVLEVNGRLVDEPELVNSDPMGEGWFIKISVKNMDDLNSLMDEPGYQEFIGDL